jgi:hypothetical protein
MTTDTADSPTPSQWLNNCAEELVNSHGVRCVLLPGEGFVEELGQWLLVSVAGQGAGDEVRRLRDYLTAWLETGSLFGAEVEPAAQSKGTADYIRGLVGDGGEGRLSWREACHRVATLVENGGG